MLFYNLYSSCSCHRQYRQLVCCTNLYRYIYMYTYIVIWHMMVCCVFFGAVIALLTLTLVWLTLFEKLIKLKKNNNQM